MGKAKAKKISPEEKKYIKTRQLVGVWSLTELRFVEKKSVQACKGVGRKTMEYIMDWLGRRHLCFGGHPLAEYLKNREAIWGEAAGFIVFKYKIRPIVASLGITKEWAVGSFVPDKSAFNSAGKPRIQFRSITASEAQDLILLAGLTLAYENNDGEIYDTPDRKFLSQFGDGSADLSGASYIGQPKEEDND